MNYSDESQIKPTKQDFDNKILFFEDIAEVFDINYVAEYFEWLAINGYLNLLNGIIIGKICSYETFDVYAETIRNIVSEKYGFVNLPIMYGLNFGHSNPMFIIPYGAEAELDIDNLRFFITENGVV